MKQRLIIGDEIADKQYNLRTTQGIMNTLIEKAGQKDSVNYLINKILLSWKRKQEAKNKK